MFDLDQFIADCRAAVAEDPSHKLVREIVERAVAEPGSVIKGLGERNSAMSTRSIAATTSRSSTWSGRRSLRSCRMSIACGR